MTDPTLPEDDQKTASVPDPKVTGVAHGPLSPVSLLRMETNLIAEGALLGRHPLVQGLPKASGSIVLVMSLIVLSGWMFDVNPAKTLMVGNVTVKANTAFGLGFGGLWLLLQSLKRRGLPGIRLLLPLCALVVSTIGLVTLAEYAFGVNIGFDQLVLKARSDWGLTATPGRMAAVTAFAFALFGVGMLGSDYRTRSGFRLANFPFIATGAMALTALLGYVYGIIPTAGLGQGIQIAIPTSIAFFLLVVGALALPPYGPWVATLLSDRAGGMLARRLLPFAVIVPLALGGLRLGGQWADAYSLATHTALSAVLTMLSFGMIIWWTATLLDVADRRRLLAQSERITFALKEEIAKTRAEAERASRSRTESARRQAERARKEKAEALTVLDIVLSTAPIGFALFDRNGRYIRVNETFAAMYEGAPETYIGRRPTDIFPDGASPIEEAVRRVFDTTAPIPAVEWSKSAPRSPDGPPARDRHFLVSYYPVSGADRRPFAVGMITVDTTERRELEAKLAQSQKMEAIGQLAGGVAHDFNNLLTVIMSYSSLLLSGFDKHDPRREDVEEITAAASRASGLTRQLLTFSRKQMVQPRAVHVSEIVRGIEKMLHRLIGEDIVLESRLAPGTELTVIDPGQLEQILMNLAVNARDAMPAGGRLMISTDAVELKANRAESVLQAPPGKYVRLRVSDTGEGMDPETKAHVFEPFFTTKETGKGTGLGLSTVYGIVKQAGGDLAVRSERGRGTTFDIFLPSQFNGPADASTQESHTVLPFISGTILLAEDDHSLRALAQRVLETEGHTVLAARNGAHALELARDHPGPIDLMATDVVMPGLSGRELLDAVRSARPGVRVLFMSGYTDDEVMKRGVLEGETPFLQKPFSPQQLVNKIREILIEARNPAAVR